MRAEFWLKKWEDAETGFHQDQVHPLLVRHWPALERGPGCRVLVPLCGKSVDMVYLAGLDHAVTGIELSALAIRQFFAEQCLEPETSARAGFRVHAAGALRLIEGDFFALETGLVGPVDAVYDRAALIAMPPERQTDYVRQLEPLAATAPILLVTLDYDPAEMQGPPFATPPAQVERLFDERYRIHCLARQDALADNPGLARRGLTGLSETVWHLRPR